jgi:hypothetical protein
VHANHPIPLSDRPFYYEIEILDVDTMGYVALFLSFSSSTSPIPFLSQISYQYYHYQDSPFLTFFGFFPFLTLHLTPPSIIGVGLATGSHSLGFPGWDGDAWAYHGDDGSRYHAGDGTTYAEKYGKGDVIGCLYESREGRLSFTKNDKLLGKFIGILL